MCRSIGITLIFYFDFLTFPVDFRKEKKFEDDYLMVGY